MGELVLIAGRDPLRRAGGTESYTVGHARAAQRAGLHPHVFVLGSRTERVSTDFGTLHRVATPVRPVRSVNEVLHRPWLVPALVRFLADRPGPHVLHGYSSWAGAGCQAARRLARRGVRAETVATFFTTIEHEATAKVNDEAIRTTPRLRLAHRLELSWAQAITMRVERAAYGASGTVVVNYESVRALLEQAYGPRACVLRLPYAAPAAFEVAPTPGSLPSGGAPLIVSVSRHDGRKGLDVLIRALAALRDDGVRFQACLVGRGNLYHAHLRLVQSLGLQEHVRLPGQVPDVKPFLHACKVFVLPSTEEGSGSVAVLEALQAGAAVVSTNVDGMPEDLTDGVDSLLVPPGSHIELADALRALLADEALRRRLADGARDLYIRRFSPDVVARSLGDLYMALGLEAGAMPRSTTFR